MGEARRDALRVGFDRAIKLEFHGAKVNSDAGLLPYRARCHLPAAEPVVAAEDLGLAAVVIRSQAAHDLLPVVREVLSRGKRRHQPEV